MKAFADFVFTFLSAVLNRLPVGLVITLSCLSILNGCEKPINQQTANNNTQSIEYTLSEQQQVANDGGSVEVQNFKEIEWIALIPEDDLETLLNPPDYLMGIADGSIEDQIGNTIQNAMDSLSNDEQNEENTRYEQALVSTKVIPEMDGKNIKIPGFVVPVELTEKQKIKSFFLVPFFGACLHVPPPPPNQIIYVESESGIELPNLNEPVFVSGTLSAEMFEDQIATSAYTMTMAKFELYYPP